MFTDYKSKSLKQIISGIFLILVLTPFLFLINPNRARAQWWVNDPIVGTFTGATSVSSGISAGANTAQLTIKLKEVALEVVRQLEMVIAMRLLAEMTKSVVNWVNSGFHGAPLFLQNPDSFFRDVAKYEVKTLITLTGYDPNRFPFGKDMALQTINQFNRKFADNAAYSLSNSIRDPVLLTNIRNNFNYGGWNAFLLNTQYPQNNYLGYRMMYTEELARRLAGTANNNAAKVKATLDQGMGFLSPKTCADKGTQYNNGYNEFQRPVFQSQLPPMPGPDFSADDATPEKIAAYEKIKDKYRADVAAERVAWDAKNTCKNLVSTTPGSVVGNQVMKALTSGEELTTMQAALGGSLAAIFDALLNHFIGSGLSSLASVVNPPPPKDDFSYNGLTLGGDTDETNNGSFNWNVPDEIIILKDFKKEVDNAIASTNNELLLMDNTEKDNPGITQMISLVWPKIRELDMCQPGPDVGWQTRLLEETSRNSAKLQGNITTTDGDTAAATQLIAKDLEYSTNVYKTWLTNQMSSALPGSKTYMSTIDGLQDLYQENDQLDINKQNKLDVLNRLESIKAGLDSITNLDSDGNVIEPKTGSEEEKSLVSLRKKYKEILGYISNDSSIEESKTELAKIKTKYAKINSYITTCKRERLVAQITTIEDEEAKFCNDPMDGGYTHNAFQENEKGAGYTVTHPKIPLINGYDVLKYLDQVLSSITEINPNRRIVNIQLSCNIIYTANLDDYKQNLPGVNNLDDLPPPDNGDANDNSIWTGGGTSPSTTNSTTNGTCKINGVIQSNITTMADCGLQSGVWTQGVVSAPYGGRAR